VSVGSKTKHFVAIYTLICAMMMVSVSGPLWPWRRVYQRWKSCDELTPISCGRGIFSTTPSLLLGRLHKNTSLFRFHVADCEKRPRDLQWFKISSEAETFRCRRVTLRIQSMFPRRINVCRTQSRLVTEIIWCRDAPSSTFSHYFNLCLSAYSRNGVASFVAKSYI
jgi:hypothetical protein